MAWAGKKKWIHNFLPLLLVFCPIALYSQNDEGIVRVILDPIHRTLLSSEVASKVITVEKKMGESFQEGDLLIKLDAVIYQAGFDKAKALLKKAEADLAAAEQLYKERTASLSELREAEANREVAKADLILAEQKLKGCEIKAPYSGEVVAVFVNEFENVKNDQNLLEIVDSRVLLGKVLVHQEKIESINTGDTVPINLPGYQTPLMGTIKRIGAVIDPASGLIKIDIEIDNQKGNLRPGLVGTTQF